MTTNTQLPPRPWGASLLFGGSVALFVGVAVWVLIAGPEEVPGHFDMTRTVTRYEPTPVFVGSLAATAAGLAVLFISVPWLVKRIPIELINVPNRYEWDTPELRPELARRVGHDLYVIGTLTMVLLTAMLLTSALVGLGLELAPWVLPVMVGAFVLAIVIVLIRMLVGGRYAPPVLESETRPL